MISIAKIEEAKPLIDERERLALVLRYVPDRVDKIIVTVGRVDIYLNARTLRTLITEEISSLDSKLKERGIEP